MSWFRMLVILMLLISFCGVALQKTATERKILPHGEGGAFVLPSPILRITSLEFKGLVSDILFLEVLTYYGGTLGRTERPYVKEWEWQWFYKALNAATDVDPYFLDPYYFGNGIFSWEARKIKEANILLEKGSGYRTWDWILPFFIGFNNFFFLQDNVKAADYLMEASRRPGANPMLGSLASKLAFKGNLTETSIQFLEETLQRTDDERAKEVLKTRLEILRSILYLEKAIYKYKQAFHNKPRNLEALVTKRIIRSIPLDPYGGRFYIDKDGGVRSTSSSKLETYLSPFQKKYRQ
jgi:hypothetical protein